jgi:hypothetical protein
MPVNSGSNHNLEVISAFLKISRGDFTDFDARTARILQRALQNPLVNLIGSRYDNKAMPHELEEVLARS